MSISNTKNMRKLSQKHSLTYCNMMFSQEFFASLCPLDKPGMSVDLVVKNGDNCYWIEKPVFFFFYYNSLLFW